MMTGTNLNKRVNMDTLKTKKQQDQTISYLILYVSILCTSTWCRIYSKVRYTHWQHASIHGYAWVLTQGHIIGAGQRSTPFYQKLCQIKCKYICYTTLNPGDCMLQWIIAHSWIVVLYQAALYIVHYSYVAGIQCKLLYKVVHYYTQ